MAKFHYSESPTEKQKNAFSRYLSEDEELVLITGLSSAYLRQEFIMYLMFPGIIFALLGGGLGWFLGLSKIWVAVLFLTSMVLSAILKVTQLSHANRYLLTTRRVMIKKGVFGVKLQAALFDKITHIEVDQGFVDRMLLHHGHIIINTAGMSKNEFTLKFVDYPIELKNLLERLINKERETMGRKFETLSTVEGEIVS